MLRRLSAPFLSSVVYTSTMTTSELKAFPPVNDAVNWFQGIDWADVRKRSRRGVNNVGLVLAGIGEKLHELGCYLGEL